MEEIKELSKQIDEIHSSAVYRAFTKKYPWGRIPAGADQEESTDYMVLVAKLEDLKNQRDFFRDLLLASSSAATKKKDHVRKEYKESAAIVSERALLTSIAVKLYDLYDFSIKYETPTFGDVKEATGFHCTSDVNNYFLKGKQPGIKYTKRSDPSTNMEDYFCVQDWRFLIELNKVVNEDLHTQLQTDKGKVTVVLQTHFYQPDSVRRILERIELKAADIKRSDSDLSDGSE